VAEQRDFTSFVETFFRIRFARTRAETKDLTPRRKENKQQTTNKRREEVRGKGRGTRYPTLKSPPRLCVENGTGRRLPPHRRRDSTAVGQGAGDEEGVENATEL